MVFRQPCLVSCFVSGEPDTKVDGVLTVESSVLRLHMSDCGGDVIVVGHVQLHQVNDGADPAVTELMDRLLALTDVSRTENVRIGRIAYAGDFNDSETKPLVGSRHQHDLVGALRVHGLVEG
jgi:hypothetical protein